MADFRLEKIDATHARQIETKEEVTVIDIDQMRQHKAEIESQVAAKNQEHDNEVARLQAELDQINGVLTEFDKLP